MFKAKWVTKEVTEFCRLKNKACKRYVKLKTIESYDNYKEKLRKSVRLNKAAHFEFEKRLSENIVNNSKSFYSYVKSKQRSKDKIGPLKNDRGEIIIMKDEQMCTVPNDYFLSIFTTEDVEYFPISQQMFHGTENYQLWDIIIKKDMMQKKLEELNSNKSQGPDEIHPRLLKELGLVIEKPLAKLFQNSLVEDVVPNDWREANITSLFKKGSKSASQNYRPVSLTSVINKLMEWIIKMKLLSIWIFLNW